MRERITGWKEGRKIEKIIGKTIEKIIERKIYRRKVNRRKKDKLIEKRRMI